MFASRHTLYERKLFRLAVVEIRCCIRLSYGRKISTDIYAFSSQIKPLGNSQSLLLVLRDKHQMQDPAAGIFCRILRERGLQSLREQINHLLPALCGALVAEIHEEAWFVRRLKETSVRFREGRRYRLVETALD